MFIATQVELALESYRTTLRKVFVGFMKQSALALTSGTSATTHVGPVNLLLVCVVTPLATVERLEF